MIRPTSNLDDILFESRTFGGTTCDDTSGSFSGAGRFAVLTGWTAINAGEIADPQDVYASGCDLDHVELVTGASMSRRRRAA